MSASFITRHQSSFLASPYSSFPNHAPASFLAAGAGVADSGLEASALDADFFEPIISIVSSGDSGYPFNVSDDDFEADPFDLVWQGTRREALRDNRRDILLDGTFRLDASGVGNG